MPRKQPFTIEEFKSIYSKVPRVTVDLIIKNSQGVLLTLRKEHGWEGQWHLPGGTVFLGEKVTDAVARVAEEELGIKVKIEKMCGYLEYPSEKIERGYGCSIALVFLCSPQNDNIILDDLISESQFFTVLPEKTIAEQKEFLNKLL